MFRRSTVVTFRAFLAFADRSLRDKALPGRAQKMKIASKHFVLGNPMEGPWPEHLKVAVFANGCFWGSEKGIWRLPGKGVFSTAVGYAAGFTPNPSYEECCSGRSGHTEAVQVVYDPQKISFVDILRWFWEAHDPTCGMGQGNDRGTQCKRAHRPPATSRARRALRWPHCSLTFSPTHLPRLPHASLR